MLPISPGNTGGIGNIKKWCYQYGQGCYQSRQVCYESCQVCYQSHQGCYQSRQEKLAGLITSDVSNYARVGYDIWSMSRTTSPFELIFCINFLNHQSIVFLVAREGEGVSKYPFYDDVSFEWSLRGIFSVFWHRYMSFFTFYMAKML